MSSLTAECSPGDPINVWGLRLPIFPEAALLLELSWKSHSLGPCTAAQPGAVLSSVPPNLPYPHPQHTDHHPGHLQSLVMGLVLRASL